MCEGFVLVGPITKKPYFFTYVIKNQRIMQFSIEINSNWNKSRPTSACVRVEMSVG